MEYAARAGSQTAWSFGDDVQKLGEYAWYKENSGGTAHPVGTKKPNAWDLHDMHGNAIEWMSDDNITYPVGTQTNPTGFTAGAFRGLRGGDFRSPSGNLRSAFRDAIDAVFRFESIGFRCIRRSLDPRL